MPAIWYNKYNINGKGRRVNMALQKNKIYRAEIPGYTAEGASVARIEGIAVFIPGGAVGDQCDIKILKVKKTLPLGG